MSLSKLPAFGFPEVSNWNKLSRDYSACVRQSLHSVHRGFSGVFIGELYPEVTYHMVTDVVSDYHIFDFAVFGKLHKHFFIEVLKVVYSLNQSFLRHVHTVCFGNCSGWIFVEMLENHALREGWLVVLSCAGVAMTTRAYFEVERTIDLVFFSTVDFSKSLGHKANLINYKRIFAF